MGCCTSLWHTWDTITQPTIAWDACFDWQGGAAVFKTIQQALYVPVQRVCRHLHKIYDASLLACHQCTVRHGFAHWGIHGNSDYLEKLVASRHWQMICDKSQHHFVSFQYGLWAPNIHHLFSQAAWAIGIYVTGRCTEAFTATRSELLATTDNLYRKANLHMACLTSNWVVCGTYAALNKIARPRMHAVCLYNAKSSCKQAGNVQKLYRETKCKGENVEWTIGIHHQRARRNAEVQQYDVMSYHVMSCPGYGLKFTWSNVHSILKTH